MDLVGSAGVDRGRGTLALEPFHLWTCVALTDLLDRGEGESDFEVLVGQQTSLYPQFFA